MNRDVAALIPLLTDTSPKGWRIVRLGDVCTITMGQSPEGASYNNKGIGEPLLNGPSEFGVRHPVAVQWTSQPVRFAEPGDILLCVRGATTGRKNMADGRYCIGRGLAAIRGKDGAAATEFLWFLLDVIVASLLANSAGSTFPNLPGEKLSQLPIALPPLSEQRHIAAILDDQMAAVERARAAAEQQLEAARALSSSYQRAEGELARRWPRIAFGELASEWRNGFGRRPQGVESGPIVLRLADVPNGTISLANARRGQMSAEELQQYGLTDGDLLFVRVNGSSSIVGRCVVVDRPSEPLAYNDHLIRVRLRDRIAIPAFVRWAFDLEASREAVLAEASTSAGQITINQSALSAVTIPFPPLAEQVEIVRRHEQNTSLAERVQDLCESEVSGLKHLASSMLRAAFRGEL